MRSSRSAQCQRFAASRLTRFFGAAHPSDDRATISALNCTLVLSEVTVTTQFPSPFSLNRRTNRAAGSCMRKFSTVCFVTRNDELSRMLAPQFEQQRRHLRKHRLGLMHLGVASRTKRDHQMQHRSPRLAMVNDDRPLVPTRSPADAAAVAVPLQDDLPQAVEVRLILPAQRVAGSAHAVGEHPLPSAAAVERSLESSFHRLRAFPFRNSISLPRTTPFFTASTKPSSISRASGAAKPPDLALL